MSKPRECDGCGSSRYLLNVTGGWSCMSCRTFSPYRLGEEDQTKAARLKDIAGVCPEEDRTEAMEFERMMGVDDE